MKDGVLICVDADGRSLLPPRALAGQGIALHERVFTRRPGQIDVAPCS